MKGKIKMRNLILMSCILLVAGKIIHAQQTDFPSRKLYELTGSYLGQEPPGEKPVVFAPGLVSTTEFNEFSASFSPDGKEFYFNRGMTIMVSRLGKEGWTNPEPASFNGDYKNHEAHLTSDNKKLFFGTMRPPHPYGIWLTERTESGWSEPQRLADGMYVTSAENGNIYYGVESSSGTFIVRTRLTDGRFSEPVIQNIRFADTDIRQTFVFHPGIAPDESYIVFDNNNGLFICFRQDDGTWEAALSINELLNLTNATIPSISPDGKYLFFAANNDLYWISTGIFQKLSMKIQ